MPANDGERTKHDSDDGVAEPDRGPSLPLSSEIGEVVEVLGLPVTAGVVALLTATDPAVAALATTGLGMLSSAMSSRAKRRLEQYVVGIAEEVHARMSRGLVTAPPDPERSEDALYEGARAAIEAPCREIIPAIAALAADMALAREPALCRRAARLLADLDREELTALLSVLRTALAAPHTVSFVRVLAYFHTGGANSYIEANWDVGHAPRPSTSTEIPDLLPAQRAIERLCAQGLALFETGRYGVDGSAPVAMAGIERSRAHWLLGFLEDVDLRSADQSRP